MHMLGSSVAYASSPEKILKMWCSLVRFEKKLTYFYIKLNAYIGTRLPWDT